MKKNLKFVTAVGICVTMMLSLGGCGGADYNDYKDAYQKMSAPGSLDVDLSLELATSDDTTKASGNMKMDKEGNMYYEMQVGDTNVVQFTNGGKLYSDINGVKTSYSTSGQSAERPMTEGGTDVKDQGTGFDVNAFMEEFATMLEAGKIKEMGLLDPIPEAGIKSIEVSENNGKKEYAMDVSDSIVEKLFNAMIKEQVSDDSYALSFSNLKDFNCVMYINGDGILDGMYYSCNTDVTVPGMLTGGSDETFNMSINLTVTINNAGSVVEVPQMSTEGYE